MTDAKMPDQKVDVALEDTFPASDPPANTPAAGTRKAEQMAREADPHGVGGGGEAGQNEPKGMPTTDRQSGETAAAENQAPRHEKR